MAGNAKRSGGAARFCALSLLVVCSLIGCGESKHSAGVNSSLEGPEVKEVAPGSVPSPDGFERDAGFENDRDGGCDGEVQWELEIHGKFYQNSGELITNGVSYEKAVLNPVSYPRIFVPQNAFVEIREEGEDKNIHVHLAKRLDFYGHGVGPRHIRDERGCVGIVTRDNGYDFFIGTFGEWDSHIEGGLFLYMLVSVPAGLRVDQLENLSGEDSNAMYKDIVQRFAEWAQRKEGKPSKQYCPSWRKPAPGWTVVKTVPDRKRRCPTKKATEE